VDYRESFYLPNRHSSRIYPPAVAIFNHAKLHITGPHLVKKPYHVSPDGPLIPWFVASFLPHPHLSTGGNSELCNAYMMSSMKKSEAMCDSEGLQRQTVYSWMKSNHSCLQHQFSNVARSLTTPIVASDAESI
jgi:hypothetical protein